MIKAKESRKTGTAKKSYELFVPLVSETGKALPPSQLAGLKRLLISEFGGLTYFPQKTKGFWKIGDVTFRDDIVILRVLCEESPAVTKFWHHLKSRLEKQWKQKSLLILVHDVSIL